MEFLDITELKKIFKTSHAGAYRIIADPTFPKRVSLIDGGRTDRWIAEEVYAWALARPRVANKLADQVIGSKPQGGQ